MLPPGNVGAEFLDIGLACLEAFAFFLSKAWRRRKRDADRSKQDNASECLHVVYFPQVLAVIKTTEEDPAIR
jgi:hypothetical protein